MKTYTPKAAEIKREWHFIDATDKVLGRLAADAAKLLMGKQKPMFSRHIDTGDIVVVLNASKVRVTGKKATQKMYYRHSNYPGGLKETSFEKMMQTHPQRVIEHAVKGMLPHNRLNARFMKKLRVFPGAEHPYQAQVKAPVTKTTEPKAEAK